MANLIRGEVALDVEGTQYLLAFDFNAICTIEEVFDLPIVLIGEKLATGIRASDLRTLFAAGLSKHQPGMTETQAGEIITIVGPLAAGDAVGAGLQAAFSAESEVASGGGNPRKTARRAD